MKTRIARLLSILLLVAMICSLLPPSATNASSSLDPDNKLGGLNKKSTILDRIENYFSEYSYLKTETVVFFFEGGSNSTESYRIKANRDQAVAVVTKNGKVTYMESECSTIPDVPDKEYTVSPSAANVLDGVYKFEGVYHHDDNKAFGIRTVSGSEYLPCIRFDRTAGTYDNYYNANGINIHGRNGLTSASRESSSPYSSGCILVGCGSDWGTTGDFTDFRNHITDEDDEDDWQEGTDYGYVVIDRKLAKERLENSELYSRYPGAVEALLDISDAEPFFNLSLDEIGTVQEGKAHNITGTISSNQKIIKVTGQILSGSSVVQSHSITPDTRTVNLKNSEINDNLRFGTLATGSYILQITATNANNDTKKATVAFTVGKPNVSNSALSITVEPIDTITKGSVHNIVGKVTSDQKITNVTGKILSGTTVKQSYAIYPNTTSVDLKSSTLNANLKFGTLGVGSYTLQIIAKDASNAVKTVDIAFEVKEVSSTLAITVNSIGTITKGTVHNITGKVTSDQKITSVTGKILSGTSIVQSYTIYPNATSVDLKSSAINKKLKFGTLDVGSYTLQITAKNARNAEKTVAVEFSVSKPSSTLGVTVDDIGVIYEGNVKNITGKISSRYKITKVIGQILHESTIVQSYTIYPNTTSIDLKSSAINTKLKFGTLEIGSYVLKITAEDSSGAIETSSQDFVVKVNKGDTIAIVVDDIETVIKGSAHNITGKISADCNIYSVTGKILSGTTVLQSYAIYPNTTSVDLKSSAINKNLKFGALNIGSYVLQITVQDANGANKTVYDGFSVEKSVSTLSVVVSDIGTIELGAVYNITGTIASNYKITSITGKILSGSTVKQSYTIYPYATSVDLKSSAINKNLKFGSLGSGSYTLQISATDSSGTTKTASKTFTVKGSTLSISLDDIGTVEQGAVHNISGTITSNYKITEVTGKILYGSFVEQSYTIYPNTTSVDLKSSAINTNLKFGSLLGGYYTLQITAKDSSGATKTASKSFTVKGSTLDITLVDIGTVEQGAVHNISGTITSNYKITSVTGKILSGSTVKQNYTIYPNATSVNLKSSAINTNLKFGSLAAGTYTLQISATDSSGATKTASKTFTVKGTGLSITVNSIGNISKGSAYNITGKVTSNYKITNVTGKILSGSTVKQSYTIYPNTTSVDLKSSAINTNLKFGSLAVGSYALQITAKDSSGATATKTIYFTVK